MIGFGGKLSANVGKWTLACDGRYRKSGVRKTRWPMAHDRRDCIRRP